MFTVKEIPFERVGDSEAFRLPGESVWLIKADFQRAVDGCLVVRYFREPSTPVQVVLRSSLRHRFETWPMLFSCKHCDGAKEDPQHAW
jgi:hypothetical protein